MEPPPQIHVVCRDKKDNYQQKHFFPLLTDEVSTCRLTNCVTVTCILPSLVHYIAVTCILPSFSLFYIVPIPLAPYDNHRLVPLYLQHDLTGPK